MGRAMLIICSGLLIAMGFVSMGTTEQGKRLIRNNSGYAEFYQAKNRAHTAVQMAFQEMNKDPNWAKDHDKNNPWFVELEGQQVKLYVDYFHDDAAYFGVDSLRIYSISKYGTAEKESAKIVSVYTKNEIELVPEFESALTLASEFTKVSTNGSASISGNNNSCDVNKPGLVANNQAAYDDANSGTQPLQDKNAIEGDPPIALDSAISYEPTDDLIERLYELSDITKISGTYNGDLGTQDKPGVFFVEDEAKLTGGVSEGYGIMVVRNNGSMSLEDTDGAILDMAGNFTFNGLIIFENAYTLDGKGTPTINGSVLIGNTEDYSGQDLEIDLNGNIHFQYDCIGEKYANQAAASAFKQSRYKRIVTFE